MTPVRLRRAGRTPSQCRGSCFTRPTGAGEADHCYFLDFLDFLAFLFFFFAITSSLRPIGPKLVSIGISPGRYVNISLTAGSTTC